MFKTLDVKVFKKGIQHQRNYLNILAQILHTTSHYITGGNMVFRRILEGLISDYVFEGIHQ